MTAAIEAMMPNIANNCRAAPGCTPSRDILSAVPCVPGARAFRRHLSSTA